ncbi:hypothetical protein BH23GEM7_BH23GEM7_01450 [soil metagenome]
MREAFRGCRIAMRSLLFLVPTTLGVLASCMPPEDPGYDKVAFRGDDRLTAPATVPPPRVRSAPATAGPAPELAAGDLPQGVTMEMVNDGQQLFGTVCIACHGAAGAGGPVGPALNDQNWIHITGQFEEIVNIINVGVAQPREYPGAMPAQGGGNFTDEQIRAIAAYVYAISHAGGGT